MIRRTAAAAGVLAAALLIAAPATSGAQEPPPTAGDRLTLLDQPIAVAADGDFTVLLQVDDAPRAAQIAVDIYDAVQPGEGVGAQPEGGSEATFPPIELPPADASGRRTTGFSIKLHPDDQPSRDPAWGWPIDEPGVYPVRVRLRDADGRELKVLMTSLIRLPEADQEVPRTSAALLVGIHRGPPEDPEARAETETADAGLLEELGPVLDVLAERPALPVTFSITPDTLARIAGDEDATDDLARLRAELAADDRTLLDAPYVDVDAASLVDADLAENLTLQRDFGRRTLTELIEKPTVGTWQLRNRVDEDTLAQLRTRGTTRALVPSDALAGGAGILAPVDLPSGGATTRALAVSPSYALGLDPIQDPVLAAHRLLGRLASTGPGSTGSPSVVVPVDPAIASPTALQIVADALVLGTPFFSVADLTSILEGPSASPRPAMTTPSRPDLGAYPSTYRQARDALDSYRAMVGGRNELTDPYDLTLTVSAAQDLSLDQRRDDAASVTDALQVPFTSIHIPAKDTVTIGSDNAKFPLPIESALDYPVKVVIELAANDRIAFPQNRIEETLDPGNTVVTIPVETRAAGDTPVRITVRSPDDGVILAESQYTIRSTAVSGVGIVLTGGAALFLAVWWARHWRRGRTDRGPDAAGPTEV